MSYETGTANGHLDLLAKLKNHLTTNSDLVAAGQQWQIMRDDVGCEPQPFNNAYIGWVNNNGWGTMPDRVPVELPPGSAMRYRVTGTLNITTAGTYTFAMDGCVTFDLLIDGQRVCGRYGGDYPANNFTAYTGQISLSAGAHTFEARMANGGWSYYGLAVAMQAPGGSMALMPISMLSNPKHQWDFWPNTEAVDKASMDASMNSRVLCLKGPGLSGADAIYVNIATTQSLANDYYNWGINYATAYAPKTFTLSQPGAGSLKSMLLWNQTMKYWIVANGRRFIVVAKVSTVYEAMYGGYMLPYALPSEYPYPVVVGAAVDANLNTRWSWQGVGHSLFWNPGWAGALVWRDAFGNAINASNNTGDGGYQWPGETYPYFGNPGTRTSPDGSYALTPVALLTNAQRQGLPAAAGVYGELDGVYHVSGYNNSSESVITVGSDNYLVVQSAFRTGLNDYAAIKLG